MRPGIRADPSRRADLCQARSAHPVILSDADPPGHLRRRGRSFSEADYAALLSAAHQQLDAPIMLVWDQLNTHASVAMRAFAHAHSDWLTVDTLPSYAPELNPVEGVQGRLKPSVANLADCDLDSADSLLKTRLNHLQDRPACLNGLLTETGLTLEPP